MKKLALLSLGICLTGCNGQSGVPLPPTSPSQAASVTVTLSGAVSEVTAAGPTPIEGVRVTDLRSGLSTETDGNGFYTIPGLAAVSHVLSVIKAGYVTETRTVVLTADTQLDIRLNRIESYTLSGVVYEVTSAGNVPVEGVEIYCDSCGSPVGHTFVYTDSDGFYSLTWAANGNHPLFVTKVGFELFDPTGTLRDSLGRITATVRGDTRFDIQLARR